MRSVKASGVEVEQHFERKLRMFLLDYGLEERPSLVLQACPLSADIEVDVTNAGVKVALAQGSADASDSTWSGLQRTASELVGSVDGILCVSGFSPPIWASELHTDGHLIAGVWDFERPAALGGQTFITWDYVEFFADFGRLASNVAVKIDQGSGDWLITATLLCADRVQYGSKANRNSNRLSPPLRRRDIEFRTRRCVGSDGLLRGASLMGKDFSRAYGERT